MGLCPPDRAGVVGDALSFLREQVGCRVALGSVVRECGAGFVQAGAHGVAASAAPGTVLVPTSWRVNFRLMHSQRTTPFFCASQMLPLSQPSPSGHL